MYINSNKLKVFPLAKNRTVNRGSRLFYEENVTNLIRQIVDKPSFMIDGPTGIKPTDALSRDLEFNIYGYYFCIKAGTVLRDMGSKSYLVAKIKLNINSDMPTEISGQDEGNLYKGLEVYTSDTLPVDTDTDKYLVLGERNPAGVWQNYMPSYAKFDLRSIGLGITGIDGAH